ncbi:MAG: ATP-dependent DNA helicase RecG [Clostridia bacterium]|nr:ATP-dependent DNA helicase RecG [Clostridia bacterium]
MELKSVKGLGPKRLSLLEQMQITSFADLVQYYPSEYLNNSEIVPIADAPEGVSVTMRVRVIGDASVFYHQGKTIVSQRVSDESDKLTIRWMNQPYRANQYGIGSELLVCGKVTRKRGAVLYNPRVLPPDGGIVPIYDLPKGLSQSVFRAAMAEALAAVPISDPLPESVTERFGLCALSDALQEIHFPAETEKLFRARYRVQFDRAFYYFLAVAAFREANRLRNGIAFSTEGVLDEYLSSLPFTPTNAQMRVLHEVEDDLKNSVPMNRLIQGDVGSGKTMIAGYALSVAEHSGKQGVLLAPTEILARQHYQKLSALFGDRAMLYIGSMTAKEKRLAQEAISSGTAHVLIGTHALLSDQVHFQSLGLLVTDEQHRFGVEQRAKMEAKGVRPDVLVMSATPIPRTLALLLYSDLSLSLIDELPQGRKPIQTNFVPQPRRLNMYLYVGKQVTEKNERAFVVCPLIEPTEGYESLSAEEVHAELCALLPEVSIGLLHGRMKEDEKTIVMEAFRTGSIRILVSTTVVEVGVDVPEATFMIIEGADHFGLATLHQLRGRVGRSDRPSVCYLLAQKPSQNARERIQTMLLCSDGFAIAQKDMEMRGYGDLFGVRQSGDGALSRFLSGCTVELLEQSSAAAQEVLHTPSLRSNELIRFALERYIGESNIARN